jgi:diguanylate cyclase (GGDEF)-like protein/PAS domain S-box-containing protein
MLNGSCRVLEPTHSDQSESTLSDHSHVADHAHRGRLLQAALAMVADAVLATDALGCIVYLNPAAEAMTGWRLAEVAGKALSQVFRVVDQRTERLIDSPSTTAAHSAPLHAALINRGGLQVGIDYTVTPWCDDDEHAKGTVLVCRPRRHAAEIALEIGHESQLANDDALFEEKERAQVTLNSIGDAVISTNFSGRVSYLNVVGEKMAGCTQGDAAGNAVDDIFRLVDCTTRERTPCPTARAIIENRRVQLEGMCVLSRRNATEVAVEVSASPIHDRNGGVIGAVMVARDVTAARELSQKLARLALHDSLTDLPNRALFGERLREAIVNARSLGRGAAVLYVDLDRFKPINDSLGHATGDKLLQTVARRLLGCVRDTDTVSRQGGDEFVVLLAELARVADAVACAEKILSALESPYRIGDHELRLSASIGIAVFPDDAEEGDALLRGADSAMYQAKYHGRNKYRLFGAGPATPPGQ